MIELNNETRYEIELKQKLMETEALINRHPTTLEHIRQVMLNHVEGIYNQLLNLKKGE